MTEWNVYQACMNSYQQESATKTLMISLQQLPARFSTSIVSQPPSLDFYPLNQIIKYLAGEEKLNTAHHITNLESCSDDE